MPPCLRRRTSHFLQRFHVRRCRPIADLRDDAAIATDKSALLSRRTATFANYTAYSRGINGIMVDIAGTLGVATADDFIFRVGNDNAAEAWAEALAPSSIDTRFGAGVNGSDRITLTWPDAVIKNKWLQVGMLATERTGLATADVFYFGNIVGEVGDSPAIITVDNTDVLATRSAQGTNPAPITNRYDHNRSGSVNVTDYSIVRGNVGAALNLIASRPLAPAGLFADAISTTRIDLDWDDSAASGVTYSVYRADDPEFIPDPSNRIATGLTVSADSDTTAVPSVRYHYLVTATTTVLESFASDVATDVTGFNEQPGQLTAEMVDEEAIELYWSDDSSNELGYTVELLDGGQWVEILREWPILRDELLVPRQRDLPHRPLRGHTPPADRADDRLDDGGRGRDAFAGFNGSWAQA